MGKNAEADLNLPPGFRFFPTDEELCVHYLCKKASMQSLPVPIIAEVDLYKYDPWQLPEKALFGEKEWYFFTPRDRKYPNGSRPNRAAGSGYWKATGADKPIISKQTKKRVGIKKALVFYAGKAPKGTKTNWIMHEYRLADVIRPARKKGSLRLDDWVLCRIYNKKSNAEKVIVDANGENPQPVSGITAENNNSGIENGNMSCDQICKMEPISSPMNLNIGLQNPDMFGNYEMNGMKNSSPPQQDGGVYNSRQWGSYNGNGNGNVTKPTSTEFVTDKDDAQSNYRMEGFSRDNHFQAQSQGQSVYNSYGMEMLLNPFSAPMETVNMPDALQEYMNNLASTDYIPRFTTHDVLF